MAGVSFDLYAHKQLVPPQVLPTTIDVSSAVGSASQWRVDSTNEDDIVLTKAGGMRCNVALHGECPQVGIEHSKTLACMQRSLLPLGKVASYTLSNGQLHIEDEPFQAFEDESRRRFVVKSRDCLTVYEVFATHIEKLTARVIVNADLIGSSSNYIIVRKSVDANKIELQAFPDFNLQPGVSFIECYQSDSAALTQLSQRRLITVVNSSQLIVRDTHPHIYKRFDYTFSSPIVSYVVNKIRIACLTADGKLHTWNLS